MKVYLNSGARLIDKNRSAAVIAVAVLTFPDCSICPRYILNFTFMRPTFGVVTIHIRVGIRLYPVMREK